MCFKFLYNSVNITTGDCRRALQMITGSQMFLKYIWVFAELCPAPTICTHMKYDAWNQFMTVYFSSCLWGDFSFSLYFRSSWGQNTRSGVYALSRHYLICWFCLIYVLKNPDYCNITVPKTLHGFLSFTYWSKRLLDLTPVFLLALPTYPSILCVQSRPGRVLKPCAVITIICCHGNFGFLDFGLALERAFPWAERVPSHHAFQS